MDIKSAIENKTILVTGGTGSFGNAVVDNLLTLNPKKIIIFSRDEKKQFDMGNKYNNDKLRFVLGDVRDRDSVFHAMYGVDYVFHAAALKQVPSCEFSPIDAIKTNSLGAHNVIDAAIENYVKKVVVLSTDKAVSPISVMGMTKALMERIMIAASRENRGKTEFCGTRFGNMIYTRGSVIPYFVELIKAGKPLTVTDSKMTRFFMLLSDSVDLILYALTQGENGNIYVKKSSAVTIGDLAQALIEIFNYKKDIKEVGARPGERIHESFLSYEEAKRTEDLGDYYKITPEIFNVNQCLYSFKKQKNNSPLEGDYNSESAKRLSKEEIKKMLLSLPEIKFELEEFKKK